jgi:hypothetical protein
LLKEKKGEMHVKSKVSAGIMVTMFLMTMILGGIPVRAEPETIRIGVVGPKGMVQWDSQIGGAMIAEPKAEALISPTYDIELVEIDEAAYPVVNPTQAYVNMLTALNTPPGLDFIVGGFRTECVYGMMSAMASYYAANNGTGNKQPVWYVCGAATDALMNPAIRPYLFRVTPINTSCLIGALATFMLMHVIPSKLGPIYGYPIKTYTVVESLTWCDSMPAVFQSLLGAYCDFVGGARPAWDETDFSAILSDIESKGAHLVIHIFSALGGVPFIKQFGESQVQAVTLGINVESQSATFYDTIGGKCEYETMLASVGTKTPISSAWGTTETVDFWEDFEDLKGRPPIYTAFGVHDSVIAFAEFLANNATKWPMNYTDYVPILEQSERRGLLGTFRFESTHDALSVDTGPTWPSPYRVRAQLPQWQAGNLEVVWPRDQEYSTKYKIPPWMYDHADTDWWTGAAVGADGLVDFNDLDGATGRWQMAAGLTRLEADMDGNYFINILDISTIALDYGYNASKPENYGTWPLP